MNDLVHLVPVLIVGLSVPLILGKIPPNDAYGFGTTRILSSPEVWCPANRAAGWFMVAGAALSMAIHVAVWFLSPGWPPERTTAWLVGGVTVPSVMAVAAALLYARRL